MPLRAKAQKSEADSQKISSFFKPGGKSKATAGKKRWKLVAMHQMSS